MKSVQAIRRFISNAWLVAAPLVLLFLLIVVVPIFFAVAYEILKLIFSPEQADTLLMDAGMWLAMVVFVLTPIGFAIYAMVCLARWLVGKKEP
jgi:hypothetical protein